MRSALERPFSHLMLVGLTCSFNSDDGYIISEMEFGELAFNVLVPVAVLLTGFIGLLIMRL